MNRSLLITSLCGAFTLTGFAAYFVGHRSASAISAPSSIGTPGAPLLNVKQLRQDMLRYNGVKVHLHALIVDFGDNTVRNVTQPAFMISDRAHASAVLDPKWEPVQNNTGKWILSDALGDYFIQSWFTDKASIEASIGLTPAIANVHYHDYVDVEGVYDANTNTVQATRVNVVGHLDSQKLINEIVATSGNVATSSSSIPTEAPTPPTRQPYFPTSTTPRLSTITNETSNPPTVPTYSTPTYPSADELLTASANKPQISPNEASQPITDLKTNASNSSDAITPSSIRSSAEIHPR